MEQSLKKTRLTLALALISAAIAAPAFAQKPDAAGGAVVTSEPGRASVVRAAEISAQVVGIDKATRTVTLKGPKGNVVDIVAGDEVKNFDQIKLGDFVVARYAEALTLELRKTKVKAGDVDRARGRRARRSPASGRRSPAHGRSPRSPTSSRVDPKKSTITLKGPRGNVVTLNVQNPDQFKVVKKGDQVEVTYTEALALSVEPAPKPAAK